MSEKVDVAQHYFISSIKIKPFLSVVEEHRYVMQDVGRIEIVLDTKFHMLDW